MKIITINLPEKYLEAIKDLKDAGEYPSRSEAIRTALKEFLGDELRMFNDLSNRQIKEILKEANNN
jgi:Arc/MetJ-type ribon-helix-helix transcriptional regulator